MKTRIYSMLSVILSLILILNIISYGEVSLNNEIQLIVDGKNITDLANPII